MVGFLNGKERCECWVCWECVKMTSLALGKISLPNKPLRPQFWRWTSPGPMKMHPTYLPNICVFFLAFGYLRFTLGMVHSQLFCNRVQARGSDISSGIGIS